MIKGKVKLDKKTKNLTKRISPGEIAVIDHKDLDQIAGQSLVENKVKAVINTSDSISEKYPNKGPLSLIKSGIPIIDNCPDDLFSRLEENDLIEIDENKIYKNNKKIAEGNKLTKKKIENKLENSRENLKYELSNFIDNTLEYAHKEKDLILDLKIPPEIDLNLENKHTLIVVRGINYKEDLKTIKSYIEDIEPFIIAVDGGADACLEHGYQPDIIIGDMDSVTDKALLSGAEIIVHAYPDGEAPGRERVEKLGIDPVLFPAPGTSEDIAMLLAYEKGAELITAVGTHSNMIDFLEKGRPGMASTLLARLKLGNTLVDAKGVSKLYKNSDSISFHYWFQLFLAILVPLIILGIFSPPLKNLLDLLILRINLIFQF